jgi:hypothetical protein
MAGLYKQLAVLLCAAVPYALQLSFQKDDTIGAEIPYEDRKAFSAVENMRPVDIKRAMMNGPGRGTANIFNGELVRHITVAKRVSLSVF